MRATLVVAALAVAALSGCSDGAGGSYDGSCSAATSEVRAVDPASGTPLWARTLAHPREESPEVGGGALLLRGCGVVVLDSRDGHRVLRQPVETGVVGLTDGYLVSSRDGAVEAEPFTGGHGFAGSSTPAWTDVTVAGGLVLTAGSGVTALDPAAGRARWEIDLPTSGQLQAASAGGLLVVLADDGSLYRVDASTGTVGWRVVPPPGTALGYDVLLTLGRTTAVVTRGDVVVGLDLATGQELWQRPDPEADQRRWAASGDRAVVATRDAVVGVDLRTGRDRWRLAASARGPVVAAGTAVVDDETSYAGVDLRTGHVLWRRSTQHHPLLGADPTGRLVVVLDSPPVPHGMDDCC